MERRYKETVDLKPYVLMAIVIFAAFIYARLIVSTTVQNYYYTLLKGQSLHYPQSYAHRLGKAIQMVKLVEKELENRLLAATEAIPLQGDLPDGQALAELAAFLDVDHIYYYNEQGEIVFSNQSDLGGRQVQPGEPAYNFMMGNQLLLLEQTTSNWESGEFSKSAYFRRDGGFFEIGAKSETAHLDASHPDKLLREIASPEQVLAASFVGPDFVIQKSSHPVLENVEAGSEKVGNAIGNNQSLAQIGTFQGQKVLEAYAPIRVALDQMGALLVVQSLEGIQKVIAQANFVATSALALLFAAFSYALYTRYQKKKELLDSAFFHILTGLPNRRYLENMLRKDLEKSTNGKKALFLIHCRNLGTINHLYGFHYGDQILRGAAASLRENLKQHRLFHFGSNRFGLYVQGYETKEELKEVAKKALGSQNPFVISKGPQGQVNIQIGIVEIGREHQDINEIFAQASLALKHSGVQEPYKFFNLDMKTDLLRADLIAKEIRGALAQPFFRLLYIEYQPIVDLKTNEIVAFEALARMHSPQLGFIAPTEFIPIAEQERLIVPLGAWVMEEACKFLLKLSKQGHPQISVAVNVSGAELFQKDFPSKLQALAERYAINPGNLHLEITESVMLHNFQEVNSLFREIKNLGIRIALDDFGTGYSSLARLEELNIDILKIDKLFIDRISQKEQAKSITGEIIAMSRKLGLRVVAEEVETEQQRLYLQAQGCDYLQGYLFSRPLKINDALQKLG